MIIAHECAKAIEPVFPMIKDFNNYEKDQDNQEIWRKYI